MYSMEVYTKKCEHSSNYVTRGMDGIIERHILLPGTANGRVKRELKGENVRCEIIVHPRVRKDCSNAIGLIKMKKSNELGNIIVPLIHINY